MRRQLIIGLVGLAVVAGCGESEADEPAAADAGEATGDGLRDAFGGTTFTWQAVTIGGMDAGTGGTGPGGYGP